MSFLFSLIRIWIISEVEPVCPNLDFAKPVTFSHAVYSKQHIQIYILCNNAILDHAKKCVSGRMHIFGVKFANGRTQSSPPCDHRQFTDIKKLLQYLKQDI